MKDHPINDEEESLFCPAAVHEHELVGTVRHHHHHNHNGGDWSNRTEEDQWMMMVVSGDEQGDDGEDDDKSGPEEEYENAKEMVPLQGSKRSVRFKEEVVEQRFFHEEVVNLTKLPTSRKPLRPPHVPTWNEDDDDQDSCCCGLWANSDNQGSRGRRARRRRRRSRRRNGDEDDCCCGCSTTLWTVVLSLSIGVFVGHYMARKHRFCGILTPDEASSVYVPNIGGGPVAPAEGPTTPTATPPPWIPPYVPHNHTLSSCHKGIKDEKAEKKATFFFVMGLEGSGHHLFDTLWKKSPVSETISELGLFHDVSQLEESLYNTHFPERGLFTAPLLSKVVDGTALFDSLVNRLRHIDTVVRDKNASIAIPFNSVNINAHAGMMSYPNFGDTLHYPQLDLVRKACQEAQVTCRTLLVYRNPESVLRSTLGRKFYKPQDIGTRIVLYVTLLYVMQAQLPLFGTAPLCWDYDDYVRQGVVPQHVAQDVWGWTNETEFAQLYSEVFRQKKDKDDEKKNHLSVVKAEWQVYLSSLISATEQLAETCWKLSQQEEHC